MQEKTTSLRSLDGMATALLLLAVFLLPLFFIPLAGFSLDFAKATVLQALVSVALLLWLVARLRDGTVALPKTFVLLAALVLPVVALISALFSDGIRTALFGAGGEATTVIALTFFFLLFFLATQLLRTSKAIFMALVAFLGSALVVAFFELIRFVGGTDLLTFGFFNSPTANPLGKWNDLALFFALAATISLFSIQKSIIAGAARLVAYALLLFAMVFLVIADFTLAWILVGVFALALFVHGFLGARTEEKTRSDIPALSLIVAIIAMVSLLSGGALSNALNERLGISQIEVRPSWSSTVEIVKTTMSEDPVLGIGPNRFANVWLLEKPEGVNQTLFWNTEFNFGISMLPTFLVTTGALGFLSWIVFLALMLFVGSKAVVGIRSQDNLHASLTFVAFLAALFLWAVAIFYVPGFALVALAFLWSGITIGALAHSKRIKEFVVSFTESPRIGFVSVLALIALIIVSVVSAYFFVQRGVAAHSFGQGIVALNVGNPAKAESKISQAVSFYSHDSYYRALSRAQVARLGAVLSEGDANQEAVRTQFQAILGNAISSAQNAVEYDGTRYQNWLALGEVYESIIPLGIDGAYNRASESYERAIELNPRGPSMHVVRARLELARGDIGAAREALSDALALKSNYTEALFLLSRIEAQEGNLNEAILQTERASLTSPNNFGVFFQLGFLRYQGSDYQGAISALERAVTLNPVYSNAKYFLGLSYEQVGRQEEAIAQFEDIETLNPENEEVKRILSNLRAGNGPFADIVPPEAPPEERDELPLEEE